MWPNRGWKDNRLAGTFDQRYGRKDNLAMAKTTCIQAKRLTEVVAVAMGRF